MKKLLVILLVLLCASCATKPKTLKEIYPEIINECVLVESNQEDVLAMLENGTGIVFFSWDGCPWCHDYINYVNEAARLNEMSVLYYDIHDDREKDTDFYKEICKLIKEDVDKYSYISGDETKKAYDSNGKVRIYVPLVIFVNQGKIEYMNYEGSMEEDFDKNSETFWSQLNEEGLTRRQALIKDLETYSKFIKECKDKIDEQGCDDACEIKEN